MISSKPNTTGIKDNTDTYTREKPELFRGPLLRFAVGGIVVFALLLVVQLVMADTREVDSVEAATIKAPVLNSPVRLFGFSIEPEYRSPLPSGNPTPWPTFTPTPTNTPTPTPTPTNTPTPTPTPTATPTPTPTIHIPVPAPAEIDGYFKKYAAEYGIEEAKLRGIAVCESGYNVRSHNTTHDYAGMYQFHPNTWISTRNQMGADPNLDLRFNAEESIRTAAFKISRGGERAWPNCH